MAFKRKRWSGYSPAYQKKLDYTPEFNLPTKGEIPSTDQYVFREPGEGSGTPDLGYDKYTRGKKSDAEKIDDERWRDFKKNMKKHSGPISPDHEYSKAGYKEWTENNRLKDTSDYGKQKHREKYMDDMDRIANLDNEAKYLASQGYDIDHPRWKGEKRQSTIPSIEEYEVNTQAAGAKKRNKEERLKGTYNKRKALQERMQRTRSQREAEATGSTTPQVDKKEAKEGGGRWARRQKLIKQYMNDGLSRRKATKIARQSIPKK